VDVKSDGVIYVDSPEMSPSISRFSVGGNLIADSSAPKPPNNGASVERWARLDYGFTRRQFAAAQA
jgi:hypothetical protein